MGINELQDELKSLERYLENDKQAVEACKAKIAEVQRVCTHTWDGVKAIKVTKTATSIYGSSIDYIVTQWSRTCKDCHRVETTVKQRKVIVPIWSAAPGEPMNE